MTISAQNMALLIDDMRKNGICPTNPDQIRGTGEWERFHVVGDKPSSLNGSVKIVGVRLPRVAYNSWKDSGKVFRWKAPNLEGPISPQGADKLSLAGRSPPAGAAIADRYAESRKSAEALWNSAVDAEADQPYLVSKGVEAHGTRQKGASRDLLIPFRDFEGTLHTIQRVRKEVSSDGSARFAKRFLKNGQVRGHFFMMGGPPAWRVIIAEGFATAATLFEATGMTSIDVGGRSNILPVAREVRRRYPTIDIVIAADDDQAKAMLSGGPNGGLESARAAALAVGGRLAVPTFGRLKPHASRTDFNDMRRVVGQGPVKASIAAASIVVPSGGYELRSVDALTFVRAAIPPREILIEPWLPSGGLVQIHGAREVGKTHFEVAMIVSLISGQTFLGWKVARRVSALLVDGEMPQADLQGRIKLALRSAGVKSRDSAPWRILTPDLQPQGVPDLSNALWRDAIEREAAGCEVVVLDSVSTLLRGPESINDAASWSAVQCWMLAMRKKGHALIWIHHDGKSGKQLGTTTRETVLDSSLQLTRTARLKNGIGFKIAFTKQRAFFGKDASPRYAMLETTPEGKQSWAWSGHPPKVKSVAQQESATARSQVLTLARAGQSVAEIRETTGLPDTSIRRWIREDAKNSE